MRRRSRADVPPVTWELPAAAGASWLALAALLLPAGRGVAGYLGGNGFAWPHGSPQLIASIGGLLTGHVHRGLAWQQPLATPLTIYSIIAAGEILLVALTAWFVALWWRNLGQGARAGIASRTETEAVLGRPNLRRRRALIRPDLHGREPATHFEPSTVGWHLGRSRTPPGVELWVPYNRTTGVYGAQGSGKTLDLLTPALLGTPGAALVTLTKPDDLLLTMDYRSKAGRPVAVLDPFGLVPGLPEVVWDPIAGCVDSLIAERRAKAFTAGTIRGAVAVGSQDDAARFYAHEASKVLQAFFHAAALTGRTLDHVLEWVADPQHASLPEEILRTHPDAAPFWDGLLHGALHGDSRTAANTTATVQQTMALFFQESLRARCVPGSGRPATDLADLISRGGTVYLLGRDDPYASASPLLTAVAEHVLDTALQLAMASPTGRLCPSFLAVLDELPSTAPLPTLRTRMANERALGLSFLYACQTWRQLVICYGEDEARALFALSNNIVVFGGGKDAQFYREISELIGMTRISRTTYTRGQGNWGRTTAGEDVPILRPEELRQLPERQALVVSENARPLIASLHRCIDGKQGKALLAAQQAARKRVSHARTATSGLDDRTHLAVDRARHLHLDPKQNPFDTSDEGWS